MNKNTTNIYNSKQKKNPDQIQKQYDEIIRILKIKWNNKSRLIKWGNTKLKLKIPKSTNYQKLIEQIISSGNETKFSKKMFGCSSFEEIIEKDLIEDGLNAFSKETIIVIAEKLSQNKKKWKFTKSNVSELTSTVVSHTNLKDYEKLLPNLIQNKLIPNLIQHHKAVVGPLGITRSLEDRSGFDGDDLVELLSTYVTKETLIHFCNNAGFLPDYFLNNKNYSPDEFQQLILTYGTDDDIRILFTNLIEKQFININSDEDRSIGKITPYGIIVNASDDPIKDLVSFVLEKTNSTALDIHLKEEGFSSGPLEFRLYGKCLMHSPEAVLNREFGMNDLMEIGKRLGLIRLDHVTQKDQLIRYLLLAMGFTISTEISGISAYLKLLESYVNKLESEIDSEQLRGLMMNVYVQSEKILKDLIYFHVAIFWSSVRKEENNESKLSIARKIIRQEFGERKDFSKPSFGQLVYLIKKMNTYVSENESRRKQIQNALGRDYVFPPKELETLIKIAESRGQFSHDSLKPHSSSFSTIDIIKELSSIGRKLKSEKIYPTIFRVTRDITNQYGISYVDAIDEDDVSWNVKTEEWLEPGTLGMMHSRTDKIAIFPFLVIKYW